MRTALFFLLAPAAVLADVPGDASRGLAVLQSQRCLACHRLEGRGGTSAPDLARRAARAYTPSLLVSLMWNHAPQMWPAMDAAGIARPELSPQQAADLFAYFYSLRYFEEPGDGARGKLVFERKRCAACHTAAGPGPPVARWPVAEDPLELARAMWNHAPRMLPEMRQRGWSWPSMEAQEMTDLAVYVSSVTRETRPPALRFGPPADGRAVFETRGCAGCHHGALDLRTGLGLRRRTLASLAAGMWNHAPRMLQLPPDLTREEMRALAAYLWSQQYFEPAGDVRRGEALYAKKGCSGCHANGPGPPLAGRAHDALTMASALWKHGPAMLNEMKSRGARWPRFERSELSDLLAYLNAQSTRR